VKKARSGGFYGESVCIASQPTSDFRKFVTLAPIDIPAHLYYTECRHSVSNGDAHGVPVSI